MVKNILISISGGTAYLWCLVWQLFIATSVYKPTKLVGVSSGYITALIYAVFGRGEMLEIARQINFKEAVTKDPYNKRGKIGFWDKISFGIFDKNLVEQDVSIVIKKFITKQMFDDYKKDNSRPPVWTTLYNLTKARIEKINIKDLEYKDFLIVSNAATAAQALVKPVYWNGCYYWEGGIKDHNAGWRFIDHQTDVYISLNARPENWTDKPMQGKPGGAAWQLMKKEEIEFIEKAKNDRQSETLQQIEANSKRSLQGKEPIKVILAHTERHLAHPYDTNPKRQQKSIDSAINSINQALS